jgi:hypothetical protein
VLEKPPDTADQAGARLWFALSNPKLTRADYLTALATTLQKNVCTAESAADAIAGMVRQLDDRFIYNAGEKAKLAEAFLDEVKCPGTQDLSQETKSKLRQIRDRANGPPAAAAADK